jgi:hypothetical protein
MTHCATGATGKSETVLGSYILHLNIHVLVSLHCPIFGLIMYIQKVELLKKAHHPG